jgi:hypothetical protein
MSEVKNIIVKPIASSDAMRIVRAFHYSGSVCQNSNIHLGVFLNGRCGGAMQFGPSMDKRKMLGIVKGTKWGEFMKLNRMAFSDYLPRNSESRALGYALRWIKKQYPWIKWIVSFADATQSGDGSIYRATGFILTQIKKNKTILKLKTGEIITDITLNVASKRTGRPAGWFKKNGALPLDGYQLRYIYFFNKKDVELLDRPIIPYSEIKRIGAEMYMGEKIKRGGSETDDTPRHHLGEGGSTPTPPLQE